MKIIAMKKDGIKRTKNFPSLKELLLFFVVSVSASDVLAISEEIFCPQPLQNFAFEINLSPH
jgi:hypothetical protein